MKCSKISTSPAKVEASISPAPEADNDKKANLSKYLWHCQDQIESHLAVFNSMQVKHDKTKADSQKAKSNVEFPTFTKAITQSVSHLQVKCITTDQLQISKPTGQMTSFIGKPFLVRPRMSQLPPWVNSSLNPEPFCQYCKDSVHLKENCIQLNRKLAREMKEDNGAFVKPASSANNNKMNSIQTRSSFAHGPRQGSVSLWSTLRWRQLGTSLVILEQCCFGMHKG